MCRMQCFLALAALYVGLTHSWDIAVSVGDELVFYTNGSKTDTVNLIAHNLTALAYDEVHDIMLYINKQSDHDAICGYNLHSKENKCFIKRSNGDIDSIAFEPATSTLFFTDTNERSINWILLKPESINNVYGNLLIKMDDRTPTDIAVDSCRGYIYWINTNEKTQRHEYMERARLNGSEREVITLSYQFPACSLAMDPQSQKIYYFDKYNDNEWFSLNRAELDGQYEFVMKNYRENYRYDPKELTVSNGYLYWTNSSESFKTVWQTPKDAWSGIEPKEICKFYNESPLGIAANYTKKDQIQGRQDCEDLSSLIPKNTVSNNSLDIQQTTEYTTVAELFCVHGIKDSETSVCKCTPGYNGERCDVSVCENYCLQGNCSFNDEGLPKCRCNAGYSGERCEVHACHGFCLKNMVYLHIYRKSL